MSSPISIVGDRCPRPVQESSGPEHFVSAYLSSGLLLLERTTACSYACHFGLSHEACLLVGLFDSRTTHNLWASICAPDISKSTY